MYAAVNIQNERLVLLNCLENLQQSLLPRVIGLFLVQRPLGVLEARLLNKVVDILEVIVKGHAVDSAVVCDVTHRNFGQRLF